jgi:hypothetical protein
MRGVMLLLSRKESSLMSHLKSVVVNFTAGVCLTLSLASVVRSQQIPEGVRYKKSSDEVNQKAKSILEDALGSKAESTNIETIAGDAFACGPLLWDAIKSGAGKELKEANKLVLVMGANPPVQKEGRGIRTPEEKHAFWKLFIERVKQNNPVVVRKAEASEIQYYWATISFDIEEPLYIADFGKQKVLVNFIVKNGKPKIFWMDIVGDLAHLK